MADKRYEYEITADVAQFQRAMESVAKESRDSARALQTSFQGADRAFSGVTGALSGVRNALGAVGVALSGASFVGLVKSTVDAADNLSKLSQRVGVTVESLSELQYAGKLADVNTEQLGDGLRKLAVNLQGGAGGSKEFVAAFKAVGISARELATIRPDEALRRIADAFAGMEDGAGKTNIAVKLLGRSGSDLIPLLNQGSAGLKAAADEARRFGLIITTEAAQASEVFNDNLTRLGTSVQALGIALANQALPTLTRFTEELLEGQRIFGSFGAALLNIGVGINPIKDLNANLRETRANIERITAQLAAIPEGAYRLRGGLQQDLEAQKKTLEFLKFQQRQRIPTGDASTLDARDLRLRTEGQERTKAPVLPDSSKQGKKGDELTDAEKFARQLSDEEFKRFDQFLTDIQKGRDEDQKELVKRLQEGPEAAIAQTEAMRKSVDALLSGTPGARRDALNKQIEDLNERLIRGAIDAKQYEDVFSGISKELSSIKDVGEDVFDGLSFATDEWVQKLQFAIEGWGRQTSVAFADMVVEGKSAFDEMLSIARNVVRDILALTIQKNIMEPVIKAGSAALGNIFGGTTSSGSGGGMIGLKLPARAEGGPVFSGMPYLVGERGPELYVPRHSGSIVPNNALGPRVSNTYYIDSRTDVATIASIVRSSERRVFDTLSIYR